MPTLIRLIVALVFLGAIAFAAMFALTLFVDPGEKQITVRIPARDLAVQPAPIPPAVTAPPPAEPAAPSTGADLPE